MACRHKKATCLPRRRVIGIDIGLKCGFSVIEFGSGLTPKLVLSGTWKFGNARNMGGGMVFIKFNQQLGALITQTRSSALGYEAVRFGHQGSAAAQVYYGMESQLTALCELYNLPFEGYSPGTIKKVAAGHGHASKEMVKQVMGELFGDVVEDDNEADARAAAITLARKMGWDDDSSGDI